MSLLLRIINPTIRRPFRLNYTSLTTTTHQISKSSSSQISPPPISPPAARYLQCHHRQQPFSSSSAQRPSLASLIKELRNITAAPIAECKRALEAEGVDNDLDKAMDWLRSHGSARASSKVSGRETNEGLVGISISPDRSTASLVKISAETDFASRNESFGALVELVADAVRRSGESNLEKVVDVAVDDDVTVKTKMDEVILSMRENLSLTSCEAIRRSGEGSVFVGYVHGKAPNSESAGRSAAIVELVAKADRGLGGEDVNEVGKRLAMHVVAAKPEYLSIEDVPVEVVEKEKDILKAQLADSGKPDDIIEKITSGKMRKFYEEVCFLEQSHMVEEDNPKVSKFLKDVGIELRSYKSIAV